MICIQRHSLTQAGGAVLLPGWRWELRGQERETQVNLYVAEDGGKFMFPEEALCPG